MDWLPLVFTANILKLCYMVFCISGIQEEIEQKIKDEKMRIALEKMKLANVKKVCVCVCVFKHVCVNVCMCIARLTYSDSCHIVHTLRLQ